MPQCTRRGHGSTAALKLHADDGSVHVWSLTHFTRTERITLNQGHETLVLHFTMGKAQIVGNRLDSIEDLMLEGALEEIRTFPERYEPTFNKEPFVCSIRVELEETLTPR